MPQRSTHAIVVIGLLAIASGLRQGLVSLPELRDQLLGTVALPARRTPHRRLLSALWASCLSKGLNLFSAPLSRHGSEARFGGATRPATEQRVS